MIKRILWAGLALGPAVIAVDRTSAGPTLVFVLAAVALIPLAWLIGEATEHAAHHTGPGIGGFLNASFGNAPELIIALFAVHEGLPDVVRGSLVGSVVGNLMLVLGFSLFFGGRGALDRQSTFVSLGLVAAAAALFLIPAIPSWGDGDPERHSLAITTIPVAVVLLGLYVVVTVQALRRHRDLHVSDEAAEMGAWSLRTSLLALGLATVVTAFVAEALTGSVDEFAEKAGLPEFFVAAIVVAIVGNAAEHGGAVIVAARGKIKLACEIALASSAQVAVFLIPAVAVLSWAVSPALPLSFRPVEMASLAIAIGLVTTLLWQARSARWRGVALIAVYVGIAVWFFLAGDRGG
ncbi:MAG: calcium/proton exchanger [Thermoleophilia bacterium]